MRKVYVEVVTRLIMVVDEDIEVAEIMDSLNYDYSAGSAGADIIDTEILNYTVTDSK